MNRIKLALLVLAALIIAALLTLIFSKREVYIPWAMPKTIVLPAKPAIAPAKAEKRAVDKSAAGPALSKAAAVPGKPVKKRKKRISKLQEPGEALGGGVQLDLPDKTTGQTPQKK